VEHARISKGGDPEKWAAGVTKKDNAKPE